MANLKNKRKTEKSRIFKEKLEDVSTEIFTNSIYAEILKKEMGNKHGIYVLYNKKGEVYYIGKTEKLRRRLKTHLKHKKRKWNRFTIYFTRSKNYMDIIEEVLISMVNPKGNKQKPKKLRNMKERMVIKMKRAHKKKLKQMMWKPKKKAA